MNYKHYTYFDWLDIFPGENKDTKESAALEI
jgi:hypothetical protein